MTYTVNCSTPILAKYVTLQMIGNYTSLQINELDVVTEPHVMKGKYFNLYIEEALSNNVIHILITYALHTLLLLSYSILMKLFYRFIATILSIT